MDLHTMARAAFQLAIVGDKIRLDIYGEVQAQGRIASMLSPAEAMQLSRDLAVKALHLGAASTQELV